MPNISVKDCKSKNSTMVRIKVIVTDTLENKIAINPNSAEKPYMIKTVVR